MRDGLAYSIKDRKGNGIRANRKLASATTSALRFGDNFLFADKPEIILHLNRIGLENPVYRIVSSRFWSTNVCYQIIAAQRRGGGRRGCR